MNVLYANGLTTSKLEELQIGPILFREEALFRREIKLEDKILITVEVLKATDDYARWSLRHHFLKEDNAVAAIINIDGAWMDLVKRKLAVPDVFVREVFQRFPKSPEFQRIEISRKD